MPVDGADDASARILGHPGRDAELESAHPRVCDEALGEDMRRHLIERGGESECLVPR